MKKLSFLALAAAGLLMVGCADKDTVESTNNPEGLTTGYMSLNIKLPSIPSTRALNDVYDDGLSDEYKVTDACLFLFQKESTDAEKDAVLVSAQKLDLGNEVRDADNDNITTEYLSVAEVLGAIDTSKDLLALVCVNYQDVISITNGTPTVSGTTLRKESATYGDLLELTTDNAMIGTSGNPYFFMTNAVTSTAIGGAASTAPTAADVFTLATLDADKIYPTKAEALQDGNEAGNVFVERAVAKATMKVAEAIGSVAWAINNTEPTSFVVRNLGKFTSTFPDYLGYSSEAFATPYYRMVGDTKYGTTSWVDGNAPLYRTYWCIDPQYDDDATLTLSDNPTFVAANGTTPLYCHENTFDVAHQSYRNTTLAVVKVTLDETETFYGVNDNTTKFTGDAAKSYLVNAVLNDSRVKAFFKDNTVAEHSFSATANDFTFTYDEPTDAGYVTLSGITLNTSSTNLSGACGSDLTFTDAAAAKTAFDALGTLDEIIEDVNGDVKVKKFVGGKMFYTARFEHFASTAYEKSLDATNTFSQTNAKSNGDLAPWNCWETVTKPGAGSTQASYPDGTKTSEENYLGRYGMVRNNWYDVEITKIDGLGEPVDPSLNVSNDDTPDDNPKAFISVKIHILSWAKRTQQWSL